MKSFTAVFVLCAVFVSIFIPDIIASECPPCDVQSNACRRWGSAQAKFQWASAENVGSSITLTAGSCGQCGESGVGYIFMDCDTHSAICNGAGDPCNDGMSSVDSFAIIKVTGNKKAYQKIFPGGISFTGDKVHQGTTGSRYYLSTAVPQIGCEYKIPLNSSGHSRIKVSAAVSSCDEEYNNSKFNIIVKFFDVVGSEKDHYTLLASTTGSIQVKRNQQRSFDPVNFKPDLRDGSAISNQKENYRSYDEEGGQTEWKNDYYGGFWDSCESMEGWCGPVATDNATLVPEDETFYRVKYPGWKESTNGQPSYAEDEGWNYDSSHNRIQYDMGNYGTINYNCENASDGSVRIRTVEREGQIQWTMVYDESNRIKYIHNASYPTSDPNGLTDSTAAYEYVYQGDGNDPNVVYKTRPSTGSAWTTERQWTLEFDGEGRNTKYIGGCGSGCSGAGSFDHVEYDPNFIDEDKIYRQKNAAGQVILQNKYQVLEYGEWESAGWIYIPDGDFEAQNVTSGCDNFNDNQSSWDIVVNDTLSTKICDPNSGTGQYLMLDGDDPDTLWQDLNAAVMSNTMYELRARIRAHSGSSSSEARITLNAYQGASLEELVVIDVDDLDLTDDWLPLSVTWDSRPYSNPQAQNTLINYDNPWQMQIVITGDKVDIDDIGLSTMIWVGGKTKALVTQQQRIDPVSNNNNLVTVLERDYNQSERQMIQRQYVSSEICRITKYQYSDDALTNVIEMTEYENTGSSASLPIGSFYTTTYSSGDDPNGVFTEYPNGKRADYQRYENGNLVESYVMDLDNDVNSLRETYTYIDVKSSDVYSIDPPDWRLKTHTNARGGVTTYEYKRDLGTSLGTYLLEKQIDPNTSAGQQVTTYVYDEARRVIQEIRKDTNGDPIGTFYNYNPTTGYLDSVTTVNSATYYSYNTFGQVIRQINPDNVVSGKSYGTGGQLVSEFIIADTCDPNDADASLTLISQTRYTYTDDGQIEQIGKYKSDTPFDYQTDMTSRPDNWIITKYEYYSNGQKKKVIEDFGTGRANQTTEYFYNYLGEIEKIQYPTGQWVKTTRNGRGLVTLEETGYGADTVVLETAYGYDDNGNLQWQNNPDGSYFIYTYDNYDRLKRTYTGSLSGPYTERFYNNAGDVIREIACKADATVLSDRRMEYDVLGNLTSERICAEPDSISNLNDRVTHYTYDIPGNLLKEIRAGLTNADPNENPDSSDIVIEYVYDKQGRRIQTIDPNGFTHSVFYTAAGLPQVIVDPNCPQDPNAFITENIYDAYGRLEKTIDPMEHTTCYYYNSLSQIIKQIVYDCKDPNTPDDDIPVRQIRMAYNNLGNITQQAVMADPNSEDAITLGIDFVTDSVYDPNGLLKEQTTYYGTAPETATTTFVYDPIGRRIRTIDPEGNRQTVFYSTDKTLGAQIVKTEQYENDPDGTDDYTIRTFMLYDEIGRLSARILDEDGDNTIDSNDPNTSFTYDAMDRLEIERAPDGVITWYEYDGFGNIKTTIENYDDGTPDINHDRKTEFVYNRLNQQYQVKAYDPNDTTAHIAIQTTTYEYDKNGNVTQITYPDNQYVTYQYNLLNKLDTEIQRDGTAVYYWYNWLGQVTYISDDPDGPHSISTPGFLEEFGYNGAGDLTYAYKEIDGSEVSESSFTYNGFGAKTSETAQYDNDITQTTVWAYGGSGNPLTQIHGNTTLAYTHDGLGRIKTIDKGNDQIVSYNYIGTNPQSIDYPQADTTQVFGYDSLGRIEQCYSEDDSQTPILDFEYTYDLVGNRDTCKYNHLATPVYDVYEYDAFRRLEKVTYADADGYAGLNTQSTEGIHLAFFAETASKWLESTFSDYVDYLKNISETSVAEKILLSQRTEQMECILKEAGFRNIQAFLNSAKSVKAVALNPNAPIYTFVELSTYISKNYRTENILDENNEVLAQIILDNKDRMVLFAVYPENGDTIIITTGYDNKDNVISNICTIFDSDGNITYTEDLLLTEQQTALTASSLSTMSLDGAVMTSSTPEAPASATEIFTYDLLGNRYQYVDKAGSSHIYKHNSVNQYTGKYYYGLDLSFFHDDNGNLSYDVEGNGYFYDYFNRLIEVQNPNSDTVAEYTFDALGRRISKTIDSETTYFFYDPQGRVIAQYTDDSLDREYVWGNGINEILAMFLPEYETDPDDWDDFLGFVGAWLCVDPNDVCYNADYDDNNDNIINLLDFAAFADIWEIYPAIETQYYYLTDALGSVRGLVGARYKDADDREFYNYDVYGNLSIQEGEESKSGNPYLFAGYHFDFEAGLYHTIFRAYDPETGRWLQFDPIGYADSMSLYEYVSSNPIIHIDPLGLYGDFSGDEETDIQICQWFTSLLESLFGGKTQVVEDVSYDDGTTKVVNSVSIVWDPPSGGMGGCLGGAAEAATLRQLKLLEPYPTPCSQTGMEFGACMVPIADPAARLVTGETVTGCQASRAVAAVDLAIDCAACYTMVCDVVDNANDATRVARSTQGKTVASCSKGPKAPNPNCNKGAQVQCKAKITKAYKRPSGATTAAQRQSVQGKPCVDCQKITKPMVADHKTPLVVEHYETGSIDLKKMKCLDSVQPQCTNCSAKQGAKMSQYSKQKKMELGL